jgi:ABC-type transport system substrate-binding protein
MSTDGTSGHGPGAAVGEHYVEAETGDDTIDIVEVEGGVEMSIRLRAGALALLSTEIACKENKWQGRNITRWRNADYDALYHAAERETDPVKRAALFIRMNDLVISNVVAIPVVHRTGVAAVSNKLHVSPSGWDSYIWNLYDWYTDC